MNRYDREREERIKKTEKAREARRKENLRERIEIDINEEGTGNFSIVISRGDKVKTKKLKTTYQKLKFRGEE